MDSCRWSCSSPKAILALTVACVQRKVQIGTLSSCPGCNSSTIAKNAPTRSTTGKPYEKRFTQTLQQPGDHGLLTRRLLPQSSVASVQTANLLPHFLDANMWHSLIMPIPVLMAVGDCELHRSAINDLRAFTQTLQQPAMACDRRDMLA